MGLLEVGHKEVRRPRAYGEANIPMELVKNVQELLDEWGEIPLHLFSILYYDKFKIIPNYMQIKGGRRGLFRHLKDMVKLETKDGYKYLSLIETRPNPCSATVCDKVVNCYSSTSIEQLLSTRRHLRNGNGDLFNPNHFIWSGFSQLLESNTKLRIVPSIFQSAKNLRRELVENEEAKIKKAFNKNPQGIYVNQLSLYASINVKVFGVTPPDINTLTIEVAELFYRVKSGPGEDILFDGTERTVPQFQEDDVANGELDPLLGFDTVSLVARAFGLGIYQKTLLLIKAAGSLEGLKINTWARTMGSNWPEDKSIGYFTLYGVNFFLALHRYGLIEIRPHINYRNDLRAFLPKNRLDQEKLRQLGLLECGSSLEDTQSSNSQDLYDPSD